MPIVAGIMPILSKKGMERMADLALGARFPAALLRSINRCDDDDFVAKAGVHWATEQCRDLLDNEVRGIHFYTLNANKSDATRRIYEHLGVEDSQALRGPLIGPRTMPDDLARPVSKAEALHVSASTSSASPRPSPLPAIPASSTGSEAGCAAGIGLSPPIRAEARRHPDGVSPGVRSVVVAGFVYGEPAAQPSDVQGKVARYARGGDYHRLLWDRLAELLGWLVAERPGTTGRAVSDTAPLLERDFARLAGLGWIGKNTMLIGRSLGSFTVLGALLVDVELTPDVPFEADHCGTCTRCLVACPTDAFDGPYRLDARRCISYWTIEHRGPMPDEAAEMLDGWAFGCDVCQDVCPWNRKAPHGRESTCSRRARNGPIPTSSPGSIAGPTSGRTFSAARPWKAAPKRAGLVRNAALILGSRRVREAVPALTRLLDDPDPTVRWAADWALRRIESPGETPRLVTRSARVTRRGGGSTLAVGRRRAVRRTRCRRRPSRRRG